jgi:hypothetical protein
MAAGYSKRSLVEKLGIRPGFRIAFLSAPQDYPKILGPLPQNVEIKKQLVGPLDLVHAFCKKGQILGTEFSRWKQSLAPDGILWVSWPKQSSGVSTDLNENIVREIGLKNGLVDIKVCAVDETWSGLKFVYRVKDRKWLSLLPVRRPRKSLRH